MQKDCFFRFVSAVVLVHISWVSGSDTLEGARKALEETSQAWKETRKAWQAKAWQEARKALESRQREKWKSEAWQDPSSRLWENLTKETRQFWEAKERDLRKGSSKRLWEAASNRAASNRTASNRKAASTMASPDDLYEWEELADQIKNLQEYKRRESQDTVDQEWKDLEAQLKDLQTLEKVKEDSPQQEPVEPVVKPEDIKLSSGNLNDSLEDNLGSKCIFCFACSAFVLGLYAAVLFGLYKKRHVSKAQKQGSSKQVRFSS